MKYPYSTQKNIVSNPPSTNENKICGKYLRYPDTTEKRVKEGGLRLNNEFKGNLEQYPLISIITICFNSEKTIERTIRSVLNQTYPNIEYIIVDGSSTDKTSHIIEKYESAIDYFISEPDKSLYHAMNKGLSLSSGRYILLLNSDDWYDTQCVEILFKALINSKSNFVSALSTLVDSTGKSIRVLPSMPYNLSMRFGMSVRHELMLLAADIYNKVGGYNEKYKIIADYQYSLRLYDAGYTFFEVQKPLLFFSITGVSSTDTQNLIKEHHRLIKEQFNFLSDNEIKLLANAPKINSEKIMTVIKANINQYELVSALISYAKRRKIVLPDKYKEIIPLKSPVVSIIIPFYNNEFFLKRSINSALSQSFKKIEVICINDASQDNSQSIIDEIKLHDNRIVSLNNKINIGAAASRNKGIEYSRGEYVFFLDADDLIPETAIALLYNTANLYDSDMVKGALLRKNGVQDKQGVIKNITDITLPLSNTNVYETEALLKTSEGHVTYLYKREHVKNIRYCEDYEMGEDSFFVIKSLLLARNISIINNVVYHYINNTSSAMNNFTYQKYIDAIKWRVNVWYMLDSYNLTHLGSAFIQSYWSELIFIEIPQILSEQQIVLFFNSLKTTFINLNIKETNSNTPPLLKLIFPLIKNGKYLAALELIYQQPPNIQNNLKNTIVQNIIDKKSLKILTFITFDSGGAARGTINRVSALKRIGLDAKIKAMVIDASNPKAESIIEADQQNIVWANIHKNSIKKALDVPGFCASELFSLAYSGLNFKTKIHLFEAHDILHLHWVVGMLDYENIGDILADKPIVWTLADMNAFTGGCHYSEGCEEYINECKKCPLLGGQSDLAHQSWKIKNNAYKQLNNLHIICPSTWLAECARKSSLLKDKDINVIPNAFPPGKFNLINKKVARLRLGLPLNKKLLLFGAGNTNNKRKGGDILIQAIDVFKNKYNSEDIEGITFGEQSLSLGLKTHNLGFFDNDEKLSLIYSAADVYVFPSREDNAPLTVAESLLCGTPVVAFPVGNVTDIVIHKVTGYISDYLDYKMLAEGIKYTLEMANDKNFISLANRCRQQVLHHHDPILCANRHLKLYQKILI